MVYGLTQKFALENISNTSRAVNTVVQKNGQLKLQERIVMNRLNTWTLSLSKGTITIFILVTPDFICISHIWNIVASRVQPSFYGAMIHHCMNKIENRLITSYPNASVICIVKYFLTMVKIEILLANLFTLMVNPLHRLKLNT